MRWEAPTVAQFARDAGFHGPALHVATSIALAASGGLDHYDVSAGAPGAGRWVGLWALNTDEWPEYSPGELTDPQRAAQVAYELTQRCAGFGWSSAWRAGRDRPFYEHAATSSTLPAYQEREFATIGVLHHERLLDAMARRIERKSDRG